MRSVIGSILYFIFMITWTPVCAIVICAIAPFVNLQTRWNMCAFWLRSVTYMLKWLCGVNWVVEGIENIPKDGAIILSKHQSAWETFAIPAILSPRRLCYVYKKELKYVPFFGWCINLLRMIPIDRSKGQEAFEQIREIGGQRLKEGAMMIFFPEGTRVPVGQKKRYKNGGTRLAVATNTPVIPLAHDGGERWPRKGFFKKAGTITVRFGKPMSPEGHTPDSLMAEVEAWVEGEMHKISPHRYKDAP